MENANGDDSSSENGMSGGEPLAHESAEEKSDSLAALPSSPRSETVWRPPVASRVALVAVILIGIIALFLWFQTTFPSLLLQPGGCVDNCVTADPSRPCPPDPCEVAKEGARGQAIASRERLFPIAVVLSLAFVVALVAFDRLRYGQKK